MSNIVVVLFGDAGFDRSAEGVTGAGQRLAVQSGGELIAVVLGPIEEGAIGEVAQRVDRIIVAAAGGLSEYQPDSALQALEQIVAPLEAAAVLLGSDIYSQEITPRLAHRLAGSSLADAVAVEWTDGAMRATRSAYGGKAVSVYELKKSPAVAPLAETPPESMLSVLPESATYRLICAVSSVVSPLGANTIAPPVDRSSSETSRIAITSPDELNSYREDWERLSTCR